MEERLVSHRPSSDMWQVSLTERVRWIVARQLESGTSSTAEPWRPEVLAHMRAPPVVHAARGVAQRALGVTQPPPLWHRRTLVGGDEDQDLGSNSILSLKSCLMAEIWGCEHYGRSSFRCSSI